MDRRLRLGRRPVGAADVHGRAVAAPGQLERFLSGSTPPPESGLSSCRGPRRPGCGGPHCSLEAPPRVRTVSLGEVGARLRRVRPDNPRLSRYKHAPYWLYTHVNERTGGFVSQKAVDGSRLKEGSHVAKQKTFLGKRFAKRFISMKASVL